MQAKFEEFFQKVKNQTTYDEEELFKLVELSKVTQEDKKEKVANFANILFKLTKSTPSDSINATIIKQVNDDARKYIDEVGDDVNVSFTIALIFVTIIQLFKQDASINSLLNNASTILVNILYKQGNHIDSMDLLIETFEILSKKTNDENKRMYYVSRSNEIARYKSDFQSGKQVKLSPTSSEKLQKAFTYKEKGTDAFKKSDWKGAIFNYHCANNYVTGLMGLGDEEDTISKNLVLVLTNNIAICNMKLGKFKRSIELLDQVLKSDPNNVKALYRRGKCLVAEKEYIHAEEDLEKALTLTPNDKEIIAELKICRQKSNEFKKVEAKAYSKMFD
ncbi:hypothetical protein DDB_G0285827 [Dictyostelium discoideum AX4]|uniref:Uncharacterized protein n=1 Tax=Dictyostelium discoideum TaxID=44689 RepID=Q54MN4_DICDI|nr:hypothetical protein DDB_G0285827 [Dictyostelium discoideum AX4]EAL64535.1 hypothetical protein DDB_G0285827 [Dictyostelium discoideum AX4]|eukprot:XP_638043.1 hypothetical protein DDB_G0285827 [Dictyostelium discoideum AX4]